MRLMDIYFCVLIAYFSAGSCLSFRALLVSEDRNSGSQFIAVEGRSRALDYVIRNFIQRLTAASLPQKLQRGSYSKFG